MPQGWYNYFVYDDDSTASGPMQQADSPLERKGINNVKKPPKETIIPTVVLGPIKPLLKASMEYMGKGLKKTKLKVRGAVKALKTTAVFSFIGLWWCGANL